MAEQSTKHSTNTNHSVTIPGNIPFRFAEVPLELDEYEWVLKKGSADPSLLLTHMDGKVFEQAKKQKDNNKKKKESKDPNKVIEDKDSKKVKQASSKGKAKAKASSKSKAGPAVEDQDDPNLMVSEVQVNSDGNRYSRTKYYLDCLIQAIRSAITCARKHHGPSLSEPYKPDTGGENLDTDNEEQTMTYCHMEFPILRFAVREGIIFAFKGERAINNKQHKKWSSFRPALQGEIISRYLKATCLSVSISEFRLCLSQFVAMLNN